MNSVDAFVAMSESVYNDLDKFDEGKKKVLGVHPLYDNFGEAKSKEKAIENLELSKDYKYILFFGIIRKYKGLDILLEAIAGNRFRDSNLKLIVAGEFYEEDKYYHDLIEKHKLKDVVILATKFIPDDQVVDYFCAADIIVQSYKNATQSGVTQIAYHFDKPMLVTNVGGLAEIVPHNKVGYVTSQNPQDIADAILDFFQQNKEAQFIKGVKQEKKKYSWDIMVTNIKKIHQEI